MFPLGIIPALIGIAFFFGYFIEKDDINRYWLLIWGLSMMGISFFSLSEITATTTVGNVTTYSYGTDPFLSQMGVPFLWLCLLFIAVLFIRMVISHYWKTLEEWISSFR